jgi:hypothetical protein
MDIPTKDLELPFSKQKVVLREWITQGQDELIQSHYYDGGRVDKETGGVMYSSEAMIGADHEALKAVVVSIGDVADSTRIVEIFQGLNRVDGKFLIEEVKKITNPLAEPTTA